MSAAQLAKKRCANNGVKQHRRLARVVSYLPLSTGTNYNFVEKVEHALNDHVSWYTVHSPEGSFTYDYSVKSPPGEEIISVRTTDLSIGSRTLYDGYGIRQHFCSNDGTKPETELDQDPSKESYR